MNTDRGNVKLVIVMLGLFGLLVIVGAVVLVAMGKTAPEPLWTLSATSIGALAALLAKTSTEPTPPFVVPEPTAAPESPLGG